MFTGTGFLPMAIWVNVCQESCRSQNQTKNMEASPWKTMFLELGSVRFHPCFLIKVGHGQVVQIRIPFDMLNSPLVVSRASCGSHRNIGKQLTNSQTHSLSSWTSNFLGLDHFSGKPKVWRFWLASPLRK